MIKGKLIKARKPLAKRQRLAIALSLMFLNLTMSNLIGQEFQVSGHLVYSLINRDKTIDFTLHKNFTVYRDGEKWLVRTSDANSKDDPKEIYLYEEEGCDGTNLYTYSVEDRSKSPPPPENGLQTLHSLGLVEKGIVPFPDQKFIFPLWLVYASSSYLNSVTDGKIKPIFFPTQDQFNDPKSLIKAQWSFNNQASNFLQRICYLTGPEYHYHDAAGNPKTVPYPPPFAGGYTNAELSVLSYTNVGALQVPAKFDLSMYSVYFTTKVKADIFKRVSIVGTVTNASFSSMKSYLPEISGNAGMIDMRFSSTGGYQLRYFSTNWYSKNDPKLVKMNATFVAGNPDLVGVHRHHMAASTKRAFAIGLFSLATIPFVAFFWRQRKK